MHVQLWLCYRRCELKDGTQHGKGKGTMKYDNGNKYKGEWENGKKHGGGTYRYAKGNVYEGEFANSKKHGTGTMKEASGDEYKQSYNYDELLWSKQCGILIVGPLSQRSPTDEVVKDR